MDKTDIQHLYNRAGFGIGPDRLAAIASTRRKKIVEALFVDSKIPRPLKIPTPEIDKHLATKPMDRKSKTFRELVKKSRRKHVIFNRAWVDRMAGTQQDLRERMTLFWANHFVMRSNNIIFSQQFNNTLRTNALGNFKDFVLAIAKEPGMLDYLNNQQNKKGAPNENFARELMELFTLGVGNYSETDIKEAARAFTGWRHDAQGKFRKAQRQHDEGEKTFLGNTGNFDGEDIISLILERPACADFIARRVYRHFVNETVNEAHVAAIAKVFFKDYDISNMMRFIFDSDWFYANENVRSKIKSPVDLLVGLMRVVPFTWQKPQQLKYVERLLGQVLLEPPNVAGWAEGRNWIDANTMMVRLKLPSVLLKNGTIAFDVKGEFEDSFEAFNKKNNFNRKLDIGAKWEQFDAKYGKLKGETLVFLLLGDSVSTETKAFLETLEAEGQQDFCIQLMSLPEYQLC